MKKLFCITLISLFSISLILGASPALAQTGENAKEAPVLPQGSSGNQTVPQVLSVNNQLMAELNDLMRTLEEAENNNDQEKVKVLLEKIQRIKEEITTTSTKPVIVEEEQPTQMEFVPPTAVDSSDGMVPVEVNPCEEMKALEEKLRHYEALYALSDEELEAKGYHRGKEEIKVTIDNLKRNIEELRIACESGVPSSSGGGGGGMIPPTETSPVDFIPPRPAPVAVDSAVEITDYYRFRIAEIMTEDVEVDEQIENLKKLRNEIDRLIEELIKSKDEIRAEEVSGLVEVIEVRPGEVQMDKVVVKTVDKMVIARVNDKDVEIRPMEAQVVIHDENLVVKAPELIIENEVLRTANAEINLMPSTIMERIRIEPEEIELREENAKAVYRIRTNERRKLFGLIPLNVENTLTVDAENTEVDILKEEKPWWAFFTTK
jgi:hypothetical protein